MKNYWKAFGSLFFLLHQGKLLWLLNAPVVGRWFRWVLRISGESSSVGRRRIFRILPNAIFWWDGPNQKAEFRTHAKFSKRLYYAFRPLWWVLHVWDWCVADRWVPELSFGFSTLTAYPNADADASPTTTDGIVNNYIADQTWATIHDAVNGTAAYPAAAIENMWKVQSGTSTNQWTQIVRSFYLFNTSALTSGAVISAAVLSVFGSAKSDPAGWTPNMDIYIATPASDITLAVGDFDQIGVVSQTGSPMAYASFDAAGYNDFTFNATGRGNISKTGISRFGSRNANFDVANTPPAWATVTTSRVNVYFADQVGTANDPKLVVTYTLGQVIMISRKSMGLKGIALMAVIGAVIKNPSISRRKLLRWWHEDN